MEAMLAHETCLKNEARERYRAHVTPLGEKPETPDELVGKDSTYVLERCALHAARLEMVHPSTGENVVFEAPLPTDMSRTLDCFRAAMTSA